MKTPAWKANIWERRKAREYFEEAAKVADRLGGDHDLLVSVACTEYGQGQLDMAKTIAAKIRQLGDNT